MSNKISEDFDLFDENFTSHSLKKDMLKACKITEKYAKCIEKMKNEPNPNYNQLFLNFQKEMENIPEDIYELQLSSLGLEKLVKLENIKNNTEINSVNLSATNNYNEIDFDFDFDSNSETKVIKTNEILDPNSEEIYKKYLQKLEDLRGIKNPNVDKILDDFVEEAMDNGYPPQKFGADLNYFRQLADDIEKVSDSKTISFNDRIAQKQTSAKKIEKVQKNQTKEESIQIEFTAGKSIFSTPAQTSQQATQQITFQQPNPF